MENKPTMQKTGANFNKEKDPKEAPKEAILDDQETEAS